MKISDTDTREIAVDNSHPRKLESNYLERSAQIDVNKLEQESRVAYKIIAAEYYDMRHMTCRAFDLLDEQILYVYQRKYNLIREEKRYIEVGAGRATLLRRFLPHKSGLTVGDVCDEMRKHALPLPRNMTYRRFSAFKIPFPDNYFDGAFAFLVDPYNVFDFYRETWRVLKKGSFILVTCPTRLWAQTLRQHDNEMLNYANFPTLQGKTVLFPSITWSSYEYHQLLSRAGFTKISYDEFCIPYHYPNERIPNTIRMPAQRLGIEVSRLPLIAAILSQK